MITIYTGLPGSGKSLRTAKEILKVLKRNFGYWKKSGIKRELWSNIKISPALEEQYEGFIKYWEDPEMLVKLRDVDIVWDEIATYLDSTQYANTPLELKRWLQQHRKYGIDIYGNTQDFLMVDIAMRRLTNEVWYCRKMLGSRDKSATRPEVEKPWGLILIRELDSDSFASDKTEYRFSGWEFLTIRKKYTDAFDTQQEIRPGKYPPLRHILRACADENCGFEKVVHI